MNLVFNKTTNTILLSVKKEEVDLDIVKNIAAEKKLLPKEEFHITIIGRETGEILSKVDIKYESIEAIAEEIDWHFTLKKEFYFITKLYLDGEQRSSIIQLVELPSLASFYDQLNQLTRQNFAVPFSHITLFTNSTLKEKELRGIGIYSQKDFENLSPEHLL